MSSKEYNSEREAMDRLLEELDTKGRVQHVGNQGNNYWVCQRQYPRYAFRADCSVRFLSPYQEVICLPGRTRNLSRSGLGLLIKHVFTVGEAIEVQIQLPGQPMMFMAGVIQFARYAGRGYHELGVALKCAGPKPVFFHDPGTALATLDWIKLPAQVSRQML